LTSYSYGQLSLTKSDIPDVKIIRSDTVYGKALWGLIDGGADIYFEYGFSNVAVQEIIWDNYRFKIEIYTMESDEAAFGIFSVSRHRCEPDSIAVWSCLSPYQTQIAIGRYYITVMNDSGKPALKDLSRNICTKILSKLNGKGLAVPDIFRKKVFLPYISGLKLLSGKLGLQNNYPSWEENFNSIEKYKIYLLPIESDSGYAVVSKITFRKAEDIGIFVDNLDPTKSGIKDKWMDKNNGTQRYFKKIDSTNVVFIESDLPTTLINKYIQAIESIN
jgi:hypothetical protein